MITPIITQEEFLIRVEKYVSKDKLTYIEAISQIAEELDVDPTDLVPLVTDTIKERISIQNSKKRSASLF